MTNIINPETDIFTRTVGDESAGRLPEIYCFCNGGSPGWFTMSALSEDGEFLAGHASSSLSWGAHDLGFHADNWKHEQYRERYPGGFVLVWVPDPRNHDGLRAAYAKHVAAGQLGTPWQRERAAPNANAGDEAVTARRPYKAPFRLRSKRNGYYVRLTGVGPQLGGSYMEAKAFASREEAASEYSQHWALGECEIEDADGVVIK